MEPIEQREHRPDDAPPPRPTWVRWLLVALLVAALLLVLGMVLTGGEHGPGRHS